MNVYQNPDPFKPCPEGWEYFHHSEKCYKLVKKSMRKMADANAYCKEKTGDKGYLVSIKDKKVGEFLYNIFRKKSWIGAKRDKDNKSQFFWADNSPVKYTSWSSGEPNNVNEGCVINNWNGNKEWIDASCELGPEVPDSNVPAGFFCEMDTAASVLQGDVGEWTQNGHPKNAR